MPDPVVQVEEEVPQVVEVQVDPQDPFVDPVKDKRLVQRVIPPERWIAFLVYTCLPFKLNASPVPDPINIIFSVDQPAQ